MLCRTDLIKGTKEFYARKIPCNILMMNEEGRVDMIKSRRLMIHKGENICYREMSPSTPQYLTVSEESKECIK